MRQAGYGAARCLVALRFQLSAMSVRVTVVNDHDDALPAVHQAIRQKKLAFNGVTVLHVDSVRAARQTFEPTTRIVASAVPELP